jgi:hypothetical protein
MGSGRNDSDWRDDRGMRASHDDHRSAPRGSRGTDRGFFERAGDEISSWFGDDEAERRREMDERSGYGREPARGDYRGEREPRGRDEGRYYRSDSPRPPRNFDEGERRPISGRWSERGEMAGSGRAPDMDREQSYRPFAGDYARSSSPASDRHSNFGAFGSASAAGTAAGGATTAHDRHYSEWRQRQIDELDRDYDEYRREHQSKFESDFSNWRSTRQSKRQLLASIREHMQVVGSDDQPVGTVDKVRGDRVILTKDDSADGQHHSLNCAVIDRVEGDRVILDKRAEEAKAMFGSEERDRALFERDDNREPGAHILNRSFSGTY